MHENMLSKGLFMDSICIIPARGGSKRVPRKNVKDFLGKPIIAYSIQAALESELFDEVMVSTDDEEIASVARDYGAQVPFMRSAKASDDYATTSDVVAEVLDGYRKNGRSFDIVCSLYPTAPFVRPEDLRAAYSLVLDGAPAVLPVTSFDYPPYRALRVGSGGTVEYERPGYARKRTQDLPELLHDCGWFFIGLVTTYLAEGTAVVPGCVGLRIDPSRVQDIDTIKDWDIAEGKYKQLMRSRRS